MLSPFEWKRYLGLDKSVEAVKQDSARGFKNAEFTVGDFEEYEPAEKFDFIVSPGSIHYAADARLLLKRLAASLTPNGIIVVSLWRHGHHAAIWQNIERRLNLIDSTVVTNGKGVSWDIKFSTAARARFLNKENYARFSADDNADVSGSNFW